MIDKYVIFADATRYGVDDREYNLADLTNTKIGIRVKNFKTLSDERNKEIDLVFDKVYKKLNMEYYDESKIEELLNK